MMTNMELKFDQRGYLYPYKNIKLEFDEFRFFFVEKFSGNDHREKIFDNYLKYIDDFSKNVSSKFIQWIDGSFVSHKEHPNDIDFVTFISFEIFEAKEQIIHKSFRLSGARQKYEVDAYTIRQYPEGHPRHMLYQSDRLYWFNLFARTKKNRAKKKYPKGFVEIEFL